MNESVDVSESVLDMTNLVDSQSSVGKEKTEELTVLDAQLTHQWPTNQAGRAIVEEASDLPS